MPPSRVTAIPASRAVKSGSGVPPPPSTAKSTSSRPPLNDEGGYEEWDNTQSGGSGSVKPSKLSATSHKATTSTMANPTSKLKKAASSRSTSRTQPPQSASNLDDWELLSDEEEDSHDAKALRDQLKAMKQVNEALIKQFDDLKDLRNTAAEADFAAYKEVCESSQRHSKDLISSLKTKLEQAEKKLQTNSRGATSKTQDGTSETASTLTLENAALKAEVDRLRKERNTAKESVQQLTHELKSLRKSKSSGSERLLDVQREAIRELYEDLTGITISTIDPCEISEAQVDVDDSPRWRFKAFFSALAHYDLEFTFEETNSTLPPGPASAGEVERVRHDLIFSPHIHPDRDREMLENSSLPRHLRDEICFDRANSVKFLQSLTRGLRK